MQFSENWLRQFVDPSLDTQALSNALTMAGLEVEDCQPVAAIFSHVVIAEIIGVGILGGLSSLLSSAGYFLASLWTRFGAIAAGLALAANFFAKRRRKTKISPC